MPIDPNIANPKIFQMPDAMDGMGKALTNALMMEKMQSARDTNRRNAMMRQALKGAYDQKGNLNRGTARYNLAQSDAADAIPELEKGWWEADKAAADIEKGKADASKTKADTLKSKLESFRTVLAPHVNNPGVTAQDLYGVMSAAFNDPDIGEWYAQMGVTPQVMKQGIDHAAQNGQLAAMARVLGLGADNALKQHYVQRDLGDRNELVAVNEYGAPNPRTLRTDRVGQSPNRVQTTVNIDNRTGSKFAETLAELEAKDLFAKGKQAQAAPDTIGTLRRGLDLVDRAFTGYWAEGKNTTSSATGVNQDAVNATQELKQILSTDMFQNIAALRNAGVTLGAVTEKEFAQLQNTVPKITDSPATIKAWMQRTIAFNEKLIAEYGNRLQSKGANPVSAPAVEAGMVPQPPTLPESPTNVFRDKDGDPIPPEAIEGLRKNRSNPVHINSFKKHFGDAAAAQVLGGAPNGGRPFP